MWKTEQRTIYAGMYCMCILLCVCACVYVCLHDRTSISLPACSALVTVSGLEGGPIARTKPTPAAAAAAMALSCLSFQSGSVCVFVCVIVCAWERENANPKTANMLQIAWPNVNTKEMKHCLIFKTFTLKYLNTLVCIELGWFSLQVKKTT